MFLVARLLLDRDGDEEIYVMAADGSGATNLTNDPAADTEATIAEAHRRLEEGHTRGKLVLSVAD